MHVVRLFALSLALPALLSAQEPTAPTTPGITLQDAIQRAQMAQPSVVSAQGAVQRAGAQYRSGWGAYIPSLSFNSSFGTSYSNGPSRVNQITGEVISGESYAKSISNGVEKRGVARIFGLVPREHPSVIRVCDVTGTM